jgi:Nnf1
MTPRCAKKLQKLPLVRRAQLPSLPRKTLLHLLLQAPLTTLDRRMHTLAPRDLVNAHLQPFLLEQQNVLTSTLSTLQTANLTLLETINAQNSEVEAYVKHLEAVVADLGRASVMLQTQDAQNLTGDIKAMEQELAV